MRQQIVDRGFLLQTRVRLHRGTSQPPLHLCSHITYGEMVPVLCLWMENGWGGSERSCNYINPRYELKIQKLLMCLFFAARAEVQLLAETQAWVPQAAPGLLVGCSWQGIYLNAISCPTPAVRNKACMNYSRIKYSIHE